MASSKGSRSGYADVGIADAPKVCWIHREIWYVPHVVVLRTERLHPLLHRVLMILRERRECELPAVWMALVDREIIACRDDINHSLDVAEVLCRRRDERAEELFG